jgi:predicted RNA binding protein YcfA (HicA-like mRNA interferase family)
VQGLGEKGLATEPKIHGSHNVYMMTGRKERISVPVHGNKDLKIGMLKSIMKIAGISEDEL